MEHINLARWADLALVAPATANTLNRLANGLADDLVGSLFLAWELQKNPWWVAPAMNVAMFEHPLTQASLAKLAGLGVRVLPTGSGPLACGEEGAGRLLEPEQLVMHVLAELGPKIA
jgi:phosphopantothenoylcysteine decarboxylase/phosphopantothenate--cysteine ligase